MWTGQASEFSKSKFSNTSVVSMLLSHHVTILFNDEDEGWKGVSKPFYFMPTYCISHPTLPMWSVTCEGKLITSLTSHHCSTIITVEQNRDSSG
jgi:hypothetical protein